MANPKDILVVTTSSLDGIKINRYLKPVSAHIVAGTNIFSDVLGELSDFFGGRSKSYQKQLISLYNEAIEKLKQAAYEAGANGIIGVSIDMDEISGKGKSMFMLTAIGTAVIIEKEVVEKTNLTNSAKKLENVGVDKINILRTKKEILQESENGILTLENDVWDFITTNQVDEIFPYLLQKFAKTFEYEQMHEGSVERFYKRLLSYFDALPEQTKYNLLFDSLKDNKDERINLWLTEIIKQLNLFDFERTMDLLKSDNFQAQKMGLRVATYDKPFYSKDDKQDLQIIRDCIKETFVERGKRSTKKQLLSSKEKEVWTCECGRSNDIGEDCSNCEKDIFGFKKKEIKPSFADEFIAQKIQLISEYVE